MHITIADSGSISKDGALIGHILEKEAHLSEKVGPTVKAEIKRVSGIQDLKFVHTEEIIPVNPPGPGGEQPTHLEAGGQISPKAPETIQPQQNTPVTKSRPPEPPQNPRLGQKDPTWLAWKNGK